MYTAHLQRKLASERNERREPANAVLSESTALSAYTFQTRHSTYYFFERTTRMPIKL